MKLVNCALDHRPQRLYGSGKLAFGQRSIAIKAAVDRWNSGRIPARTQTILASRKIVPEHVAPDRSLPVSTGVRNRQEVDFCTAEMKDVWAPCCRKSATESVDVVFDRLLAFSEGCPPHDDITAVVLKVLP